ncbi:heat shock protein 89.1 [Tanacetum coccineum]
MVPAATPDCYCQCRISAPPHLTTTVSLWHRNQGPPSFEDSKDAGTDSNLIGQFGVGFYSAFLVDDKLQNPKEVTTPDYNEFYRNAFNEYLDPLASSHFTTEVKR